MAFNFKNLGDKSENAGLLISILMRYPEIEAISFNPEDNTITLSFSCCRVLNDDEFQEGKKRLELCLDTYAFLENKKTTALEMECLRTEEISVLKIIHNIEVATKNEISLIISFLQQEFGDCLMKELYIGDFQEEDLLLQEEFIGHMLENFKGAIPVNKLIAFREEGKVHLFKK